MSLFVAEGILQMEQYREYLQYSLWVSDVKKRYLKNEKGKETYDPECITGIWLDSGSHGKYPVGVKKCTFEEYIDLIRTGHTVKRIRHLDGTTYDTRFLFIDLDNDIDENVTEEELKKLEKEIPGIRFLPSTSGNPNRWHIYLQTEEYISDNAGLESEVKRVLDILREICGREVSCDTSCYRNWYQVCYGMPQDRGFQLDIPEGTEFFCQQILKSEDYDLFSKVKRYESYDQFMKNFASDLEEAKKRRIVPYNSRMLARELNLPVLVDKSFSIYPPFTYKSKRIAKFGYWKIQKGDRYHTAQSWMIRLVFQWYKCILKYHMNFKVDDLLYTLAHLCRTNFEGYEEFNMRGIFVGAKAKIKEYARKSYEEIERKAEGQIRTYREKNLLNASLFNLVEEYRNEQSKIRFRDRREMIDALERYRLNPRIAKRRLKSMGYEIEIIETKRTNRCSKIDFDKYESNELGQKLIPRSEMTQQLRNRASKLKIKLKMI
jgi:hypothetical protein